MNDRLLTTGEAAEFFGVNVKTMGRWGREGKVPCFKTPGGHHRFYLSQILALVKTESQLSESSKNP